MSYDSYKSVKAIYIPVPGNLFSLRYYSSICRSSGLYLLLFFTGLWCIDYYLGNHRAEKSRG